jgi:hypothetical protein
LEPIKTDSNHEIVSAGQNLLKHFGEDLFSVLSSNLEPVWGKDWFEVCTKESKSGSAPKKDLLGILREIVDFNNSALRVALSQEHSGSLKLERDIIDALDQIRKSRNIWAHEELAEIAKINESNLMDLAKSILIVTKNLSTRVHAEQIILALKDKNLISLIRSAPHISRIEPQIVQQSAMFKNLQAQIESLNEKAKTNNGLIEIDEAVSSLILSHHLMCSFQYKYESTLIDYRLLMSRILGKIWVDSAEYSNFIDYDETHEVIEEIKSILHNSKYNEEVFKSWVSSYIELGNEWNSRQGIANCDCDLCANTETERTGPYLQEDSDVKDFLYELIFKDETNIRFLRMKPDEIIKDADFDED